MLSPWPFSAFESRPLANKREKVFKFSWTSCALVNTGDIDLTLDEYSLHKRINLIKIHFKYNFAS